MQVRFWCGPLRPMCGTHKRTHARTHVRTYPNGAARNALMPWYIANLHHGGSRTVILSLARLAVHQSCPPGLFGCFVWFFVALGKSTSPESALTRLFL